MKIKLFKGSGTCYFVESKQLIAEIKIRLESLKADASKLYQALPGLFKATEQLSVIDKSLASELKTRFLELSSLTDDLEIISKIEEIKTILSKLETQTITKPEKKRYLGVSQKFYTEDYKKASKLYEVYKELIDKKEDEIINAPEYSDRLHEPLKKITKRYGRCLHARLRANLRIIYKTVREKNLIMFLTIVSHDEMDRL